MIALAVTELINKNGISSLEMQVMEGNCGDFHPLTGVSIDIKAKKKMIIDGVDNWLYDPNSELRLLKVKKQHRVAEWKISRTRMESGTISN